jgi:hypothetical protein
MYKQWFTKHNNPQDFKYNRALRRDEAAKFFVSYAKNILGKRLTFLEEKTYIYRGWISFIWKLTFK